MVELAPQLGALTLALEHRYYGKSNPFGMSWSTDNLQYLSTPQAVEDIATFLSFVSTKYGLTSANKVVTFGGSYPGMVSAFARLKHPELVHASVSSSAPVQAKVDMEVYNDIVSYALADPDVGGSDACLATVVDGHSTIADMLETSEGRAQLAATFNLCNADALEDEDNRRAFAGNGVVYVPAQSNDPACTTPLCNIDGLCDALTSPLHGTSAMDRLAYVSHAQHVNQCVTVDYNATVTMYAHEHLPERAWSWQTCTEYGFYVTCEKGSKCPYARGYHPIDWDLSTCRAAFGTKPDAVFDAVAATNVEYYSTMKAETRCLSVNGDVDPWHGLAITEPLSPEMPAMMVRGSSHHYWTHPSAPTDNDAIVAARQAIWAQVTEWLQEE